MKIVLIDPSLFTLPYDRALADGLVQNGDDVRLFGKHLAANEPGKNTPGLEEFFYPGLQSPHLKKLPRVLFLAVKGFVHLFCLAHLVRRLRKFQPDIIHFQWTPLPVIDRLFIPYFRRIAPVILTVHDSTPFNANPRAPIQSWGAMAILKTFDRLIVHTVQAQQRLAAYGISENRIGLIPHGLLQTNHTPSAPSPRKNDCVTLLLFGKLKPYKGADILIRALAALPAALHARTRLRIAGQAYMDVAVLRAMAEQLGVNDMIVWDVRFFDDEEMTLILNEADIMVMPYREIDASGVLMQALAIGRPIVATRIGLFAEILENGRHGYLVPPDDPPELARALATLIEDSGLRHTMGYAVRDLKATIPDWNMIAAMTQILYREAKGVVPSR